MNNRQNELITSLSRFLLRLSNTNYTNIASNIKCFTITNVKTLYITYFLCLLKHCTWDVFFIHFSANWSFISVNRKIKHTRVLSFLNNITINVRYVSQGYTQWSGHIWQGRLNGLCHKWPTDVKKENSILRKCGAIVIVPQIYDIT